MISDLPPELTVEYIPAATREPVVTVNTADNLDAARTLMELNDFSQLPVLPKGKGRTPLGVVSWDSIGRQLMRSPDSQLQDCVDGSVKRLEVTTPLVDAIHHVNRDGSALIIGKENRLSGIVTVADLGESLADLATPFLEIERCEQLLRAVVRATVRNLDVHLLRAAGTDVPNVHDTDFTPNDLTMGALVSIIASDGTWPPTIAGYDSKFVREALNRAVAARNSVMHFRPRSSEVLSTLAGLPHLNKVLQDILRQSSAS